MVAHSADYCLYSFWYSSCLFNYLTIKSLYLYDVLMMKRLLFFFVLFLLSLSSIFLAYKVVFFIGETYFFDKLFYFKSPIFGYWKGGSGDVSNTENTKLIEKRVKELKKVITNYEQSFSSSQEAKQEDGVYKIVIIGDSITYGMGVRYEDTFPKVVERELNKIRPTKVYVLAQPGDDLVDNFTKFKMSEKSISADLYVFTLVDNDLVFNHPNWISHDQEFLVQLKEGCSQPDFPHPIEIKDWPTEWDRVMNELYYPSFLSTYSPFCVLQHMAKLLPKEKTLFLSMFQYVEPKDLSQESSDYDRKRSYVFDTYTSVFREQGMRVIAVSEDPHFQYIPVSSKEGHPSAATHRQYSQLLFREITRNPLWKF